MLVLGTELGSSSLAVVFFIHRAIFAALIKLVLMNFLETVLYRHCARCSPPVSSLRTPKPREAGCVTIST